MHFDIAQLFVIAVVAGLLYWANNKINDVPKLNQIFSVLIVVGAVLMVLASIFHGFGSHVSIN